MAEAGARVACVGLPAAGVESVSEELAQAGHEALAVVADVADGVQTQAAVARAVERFGRLDIVVASAWDSVAPGRCESP